MPSLGIEPRVESSEPRAVRGPHARVRLAGVYRLRRPQLPHPEGDPRRQPAGAEKILPQGTQAHAAQGITEEMTNDECGSGSEARGIRPHVLLDQGEELNRLLVWSFVIRHSSFLGGA